MCVIDCTVYFIVLHIQLACQNTLTYVLQMSLGTTAVFLGIWSVVSLFAFWLILAKGYSQFSGFHLTFNFTS